MEKKKAAGSEAKRLERCFFVYVEYASRIGSVKHVQSPFWPTGVLSHSQEIFLSAIHSTHPDC